MAPKVELGKLGVVRQHRNKWMVQVKLFGNLERGPGRNAEAEAVSDRDNARLSVSREEYVEYLVVLRESARSEGVNAGPPAQTDASASTNEVAAGAAEAAAGSTSASRRAPKRKPEHGSRTEKQSVPLDRRTLNRGTLGNRGGAAAHQAVRARSCLASRSASIRSLDWI